MTLDRIRPEKTSHADLIRGSTAPMGRLFVAWTTRSFAIVVGNPGRVLRMRFGEAVVEPLLPIAWWDWPHKRQGVAMGASRALGAEAFCEKYQEHAC